MPRQRTLVITALCVVLAAAIALTLRVGTRAAPDPIADQPPLIQRPNLPPTPVRPSAPQPAAAPQGGVLFQDSFDSASSDASWAAADLEALTSQDEPARWRTMDGMLRQIWTGDHQQPRPGPTIAAAGSPDWRDYTLVASAYAEENIQMGVVVRRQGNSFYRLRMLNDVYTTKPKLVLEKVINGQATVLASHDEPGYQNYRWYTFKVSVSGSRISAQVDDLPPLVAEDSSLTQGQIGLYGFATGQLGFDNVTVSAP
jgi:hypothetical protein